MSRKTIAMELISWTKSLGIAFVLALIINIFVFEMTGVDGRSMNPTLNHGDRLFAIKTNQIFKSVPKYGDIVIVDGNINKNRTIIDEAKDSAIISTILRRKNMDFLIKRVIGVPGDTLEIRNNKLYRNGELIEEIYIFEEMITEDMSIRIPDGHVFVMGDNRNDSRDSRDIGPIPLKNVRAKVIIRLYPFNKMGKL
ncbi:signal peptidase I [Proteiniborus ethanoligenes]|uniref:Signal peptidase I n=1 Tax=Proteiniborus ethanoligenes TaxID=415015 RepID=A0A1H3RK95_9FIRM|nr:signal peptidase I [Proteiniborus ethanoligenes]SDZ26050.1 signal peptidase I [Proteiniborus ethanoligenes]